MTPKRKINKRKISTRSNKTTSKGTFVVISKAETMPMPIQQSKTFINKILKLGGKAVVTKKTSSKVSVIVTMKSVPMSSTKANTLAAKARASGAAVMIQKQ